MEIGKIKGSEKAVIFDKGLFLIDGSAIESAKLAEYDGLEIIEWKSDELKMLTYSMMQNSGSTASADAIPNQSYAASAPAQPISQEQRGFTGQQNGRRYLNGVDITNEDSYWQEELTKIYESQGRYSGKFNWAAFLAGGFWFFAKSLPIHGLIWMAVLIIGGILTWMILPIVGWVFIGFRANFIRYKKLIENVDVYF
ncbi:MAG: DUF2628 domain-containing protein [Streptococcaceae bacterium]|nr:DUF2628 domain-containing protein [Streptococcaceae bacterium]